MSVPNTLFLRLEGPLQAWGGNSKFVVRRTQEAPTKSGVLGMICCAKGVPRSETLPILERLNRLAMGVRIDRPGTLWSDYHTVGAGYGLRTAEGKLKTGAAGTLITRRYYLCDASFLVALQGDSELVSEVHRALADPKCPLYLGRKCCVPSLPIVAGPRQDESWTNPASCGGSIMDALCRVPWAPRLAAEKPPGLLDCIVEWEPTNGEPAPPDAEVWHDAAVCFDPPVHEPRLVTRQTLSVPGDVPCTDPLQRHTPSPARPRAGYGSSKWRDEIRPGRLKLDRGLCVFCKAPATTVQHITYRHAGGDEREGELRALCRLCHDAVTMIEYGLGMGLDRINPEDPRWREDILRTRAEILQWRSEEGRRRALRAAPPDVRRDLLEEEV